MSNKVRTTVYLEQWIHLCIQAEEGFNLSRFVNAQLARYLGREQQGENFDVDAEEAKQIDRLAEEYVVRLMHLPLMTITLQTLDQTDKVWVTARRDEYPMVRGTAAEIVARIRKYKKAKAILKDGWGFDI